jgi:catechol 2,3-dioxygenase-like lactoylglutathione lyase family enzyme
MTAPSHPQTDPPVLGEHDGHVIYPMPMFLRLTSPDPRRLVDFYTRALGFDAMFLGPEADGVPVLVHLRRAKYQDVLVVRGASGQRTEAGSEMVPTFAAADADEIDALAERLQSIGHGAADMPVDTTWNTRDLAVVDPDHNRIVFTARARTPVGGSITEVMERATQGAPGS